MIAVMLEFYDNAIDKQREERAYVMEIPRKGDIITYYMEDRSIRKRVCSVELFLSGDPDTSSDITVRLEGL